MGIFVVIIFIVLAVVISLLKGQSHERKKTERIESMGGTVINIEKKLFSTRIFMMIDKG
ncbi:hypothetical protein [Candidatus Clostridium radicumherbarum]|uniref:Preprotein translocase subunit YajC n=1 Tax=Candidatus Clostridium radicumherbarum TaxID=3381662 RepID=A0ABW8U040_9CLOT